jgi:hypothetical protein
LHAIVTGLPLPVRSKILEYLAEKTAGLYGDTERELRRLRGDSRYTAASTQAIDACSPRIHGPYFAAALFGFAHSGAFLLRGREHGRIAQAAFFD